MQCVYVKRLWASKGVVRGGRRAVGDHVLGRDLGMSEHIVLVEG